MSSTSESSNQRVLYLNRRNPTKYYVDDASLSAITKLYAIHKSFILTYFQSSLNIFQLVYLVYWIFTGLVYWFI